MNKDLEAIYLEKAEQCLDNAKKLKTKRVGLKRLERKKRFHTQSVRPNKPKNRSNRPTELRVSSDKPVLSPSVSGTQEPTNKTPILMVLSSDTLQPVEQRDRVVKLNYVNMAKKTLVRELSK